MNEKNTDYAAPEINSVPLTNEGAHTHANANAYASAKATTPVNTVIVTDTAMFF